MTVNITCHVCDGRRLCDACRAAARRLSAAGYRVEHSTRYAALRAAASGTYGFEACIVPVASGERAVGEAAIALLAGKRLALVGDDESVLNPIRASATMVLPRATYESGNFDLDWLTRATPSSASFRVAEPTTIAMPRPETLTTDESDRAHATRRMKRLADDARDAVAKADLPDVPRLDLVATLDDEVAWARASGAGFAVVLVHLPGLASDQVKSPQDADQRVRDAQGIISKAVRATDSIAGTGDDFLVVIADADGAGAEIAARRVAAAIAGSALRAFAGKTKARKARGFAVWSVGLAAYPADGVSRDSLIAHATAAFKPI